MKKGDQIPTMQLTTRTESPKLGAEELKRWDSHLPVRIVFVMNEAASGRVAAGCLANVEAFLNCRICSRME